MIYYRTTSHTKYDNKYHIVFITKYRKQVLTNDVGLRAREIIRQVCEQKEVHIIKGAISPDHVHLFVSIPPHHAISTIVQQMKGRSSRILQNEFKHLQKMYWGRHFWAIGYFCATSGTVTDEIIMRYIENQDHTNEDNIFSITPS